MQDGNAAIAAPAAPVIAPEIVEGMRANGIIPPLEKADAPPAEQTPAPPVDIFQPFKEKFGYTNPEDAIAEIEQLRALKANPPAPTIEFEDAESEQLFKAFQAGKRSDVYTYLEKATKIENYLTKEVNDSTASDIVKLGMQLKYKDLTPAEIDYKFNKQFSLPAKPVPGADELPEEYATRVSAWEEVVTDKKMELLIEAKLARPDIEGAKSKLVLPTIEETSDEGYVQYKKALEENQKLASEAEAAYKTFTPKTIETKLNFKDEANKIDFTFQYEPDAESFSKAIELTSDINKFWDNFYNQDGSPNRQKFLDFVYAGLAKDKMLSEAMKQAKNATIKSLLPDNSAGGLVRQLPSLPGEETELDKNMRLAGIKRAN